MQWRKYRIAGFSNSANFSYNYFIYKPQDMKIKILRLKISTTSNFERVILTHGNSDEAMAFYRHFQPLDDLPDRSRLHPLTL